MTGTILIVVIAVLVIVIVKPLRSLAGWIVSKGLPQLFELFKVFLHLVVGAHVNVMRNLQPRQKLIFELNRKRTSHTQDH